MRFRNGLPRQCAHWLAMTGFFDSLEQALLPEGLFLFTQNWEADNTQQPQLLQQ